MRRWRTISRWVWAILMGAWAILRCVWAISMGAWATLRCVRAISIRSWAIFKCVLRTKVKNRCKMHLFFSGLSSLFLLVDCVNHICEIRLFHYEICFLIDEYGVVISIIIDEFDCDVRCFCLFIKNGICHCGVGILVDGICYFFAER